MNTTASPTSDRKFPIRQSASPLLAGLLAFGSFVALAATEPTQAPLTTRAAAPPPPNVMVTVDNSISTQWDFMPEGDFKVNSFQLNFGHFTNTGDYWLPLGFPNNPIMSAGKSCVVASDISTSTDAVHLFQAQYRSPDVNSIYYNPDIYYRPWVDKDDLTKDMAVSSAGAALWDPFNSTGTLDLTTAATVTSTKWCKSGSSSTTSQSMTFSPGIYYRLKSGKTPDSIGNFDRYYINSTSADYAPATKNSNRTDCAGAKCTQAEERQNFANWFTYYRTRQLLIKAGLGRSLTNFIGKVRMDYTFFSDSDDAKTITHDGMQSLSSSVLSTNLAKLYGATQSGSTPTFSVLKAVGLYFSRAAGDKNPWLTSPSPAKVEYLSCRRSINLLLTDGYYNYQSDSDKPAALGFTTNEDGTAGPTDITNPVGYSPSSYAPSLPYSDKMASTLADAAMTYYKYDLQNGKNSTYSVDNRVPPINGDIAYWQHLTQFMVGLGVSGSLDASSTAAKQATLNSIKAGSLAWPDPTTSEPAKIDDMWHASVNTGGDFYSVRNVTELSSALVDAIGRAAGTQSKEAGVAVASNTLATGNLEVIPKYVSGSWYGDLEAYAVDSSGKASTSPTWTANSKLPAAASRNLYTWNPDSSTPVAFNWGSVGATNQTSIGDKDLPDYIRGVTTYEGAVATTTTPSYRVRGGNLLGDFINSTPVYVKSLVDLKYDQLDAGYRTYVKAKTARSTAVVFQGGNAGILHAFNGSTGVELFGYLPSAGLSNLKLLGQTNYGSGTLTDTNYHRYFVDGPVVETDAFISTRRNATAAWANVVVGSMGAGGKSFFALHVSTDTSTTFDEKSVLWESPKDDDIGNVLGQIAVGKIAGSGWKAFVPNGVYSPNGHAVLLVVNLSTGAIDGRIIAGSSTGNGLMNITLLRDATQAVVGAYGGDLQGNLWRFDFESSSSSGWKLGFKGSPLFQAKTASGSVQPITIAPTVVSHGTPAGHVVMFGTGKLIDSTDADDTTTQSFYGVLDTTADGASSSGSVSPFNGISNNRTPLSKVTISSTGTNGSAGSVDKSKTTYYQVTGGTVDWTTQHGWVMDFPTSRQRVIYPTLQITSDYILIQSMVPAATAATCETSTGKGFNYLVATESGSQATAPVYDTNGDGVIDDKDMVAGGYSALADGVDQVVYKAGSTTEGVFLNTGGYEQFKIPSGTHSVTDRTWRRIMNPPHP